MKDYMTFEEALQDPSLTHYHEVIHFLEENEDKILFPKKYMMSLKLTVDLSLKELFQEAPDMPLLKVLTTTFDGMNDKLTSEMILEITAHILKEWEKLSLKTPKTKGELQHA